MNFLQSKAKLRLFMSSLYYFRREQCIYVARDLELLYKSSDLVARSYSDLQLKVLSLWNAMIKILIARSSYLFAAEQDFKLYFYKLKKNLLRKSYYQEP